MTKQEYEHIRYEAAKAYKALKEDNKSDCFAYLWMLNYRLGMFHNDYYSDGDDSGT